MASSILASLDMSLDDLIDSRKKKPTTKDARPAKGSRDTKNAPRGGAAADRGAAGPVRNNRRNRRGSAQPYSSRSRDNDDDMDVEDDDAPKTSAGKRRAVVVNNKKGGKKGASILSRLGGNTKDSAAQSGTKILVKNLKFDILEDDVRELFATVGEVKKAEIVYDRSGRSRGISRVWFARRSDAEKAIAQYDGRTLDGQAMQITLDENVRKGLFGTALATREDKDVKFKVSLGNGDSDSKERTQQRERGDRNTRGRGGRGGRERGRGRDARDNNAPSKSVDELDNEMDSYMKDA